MGRKKLEPDETAVGSVRTLLGELESLDRDAEHTFFYRGHSDKTYALVPSIYRNGGWIENEDKMFRELVLRCPDEFRNLSTTFQKLVKMQHYALPTRLLDLTGNPLIALFFACSENNNLTGDGEVVIFRIPKKEIKYFDSDTVSVIANVSKQPLSFNLGEHEKIEPPAFSDQEPIKLLIHDIRQEKSLFEPKINPEHLKSVICVKPLQDNPRIMRQDGAFFLFGVNALKTKPAEVPRRYVFRANGKRLIVRAYEKKRMREQLEALGISAAKIYPEIDSVALYVKNLFKDELRMGNVARTEKSVG